MDDQRFDRLARRLAGGVSRRAVLRGMAAGLAGAAGLRAGRAGAGQEKKALCHATGDPAHPWVVISVAEPAWDAHDAHGDHDFVDDDGLGCCADADCTAPATCGGDGVEGECGGAALLGFGAACAANAACASGVCACQNHDCAGGGVCADPFVPDVCPAAGGDGGVFVITPGGVVRVCVRFAPDRCDADPCPAGQGCGGSRACFELVDSAA